jgi:hypothetical protein
VTHGVIHPEVLSRQDRRALRRWDEALSRGGAPYLVHAADAGESIVYSIPVARGEE